MILMIPVRTMELFDIRAEVFYLHIRQINKGLTLYFLLLIK